MTLDVELMQRSLLRFDLAVRAPVRPPLDEMLRYYQIDFFGQGAAVAQSMGYCDVEGYRLCLYGFLASSAQGTVWLVHGYFDHVGLYGRLIKECLQQGFNVMAFDLPGHGLSSGERSSIGNFAEYQRILSALLDRFAAELPLPFVAVGQSTGGAIILDHILSAHQRGRAPAFTCALLLAPLVRAAQWRQVEWSHRLLGMWLAKFPRKFRQNTSDQAFLDFIRERDPLQDRAVDSRWVGALRRWVSYMETMPTSSFPLRVIQGHKDETVDWRYNLQYLRKHFSRLQVVEIPEASHQLANEGEQARQVVLRCLKEVLEEARALWLADGVSD